jgi:hypothetical protein
MLSFRLAAADFTIDHVSVAGVDVKQMQARLNSVGIVSEYGGPHSNRATEMAQTSFPDGSYLELIAVQPHADAKALAAHYWSKQMQGNAGPTAWAIRAGDLNAEAARLRANGVVVTAPARSGRARPDGVRLEWETANVGPEPNGTFFPFLIHDITPREWRAFPRGAPASTNFRGIKRVIIAVRDLRASIMRYQKAFGLPSPIEEANVELDATVAWFPGTPVVLAAPLNPRSWLGPRLNQFGEGPCAFVLGTSSQPANAPLSNIHWFDAEKLGWRLGVEP